MKIEILGCDGGVGPGLRTTCLRINDRILIDAGTGACELDGEAMAALSDVFLTHAHVDHVMGLAFIAAQRKAARPLTVHGDAAALGALKAHLFNWALWPDFTALPDAAHPALRLAAMGPGPLGCHGLQFAAFPSLHTVPAIGYAVTENERSFAFTGDTYGHPEMWRALNALPRLDQLMIEVSYPDAQGALAEVSRHLTPARLAQQLKALHHWPELLLTHHKPGYATILVDECRTALDHWRYRHLYNGDLLHL
ncbi:MAG TPA: 3',5'-cyclic-nucleotide phosphodiesterase [Nevskiaceae bacterium]